MLSDDYEFQILKEEKKRSEIIERLPLRDEDDAADVLVGIDRILIRYREMRDDDLDNWQTANHRKKAVRQLEDLASHLEDSLSSLEGLSPLARAALVPNVFDDSSVLGILLGSMDITKSSVWPAYEKRIRSLVGDVETSRQLLIQLRFPNRNDETGEAGQPMKPMVSAETLSCGLRQNAAMASAAATQLSERPLKRGKPPSLSDLFITERLRAVWERYTGRRAAPSMGEEEDGRFLRFARTCARLVESEYGGHGALRDLRTPG